MRIAYVNYGAQSGVTENVMRGLSALGHELVSVDPTSILELRDPRTRRPRPTPRVLLHLAASAMQHGRGALAYRWNTTYAFDVHSRRVGELLTTLDPVPDVVVQAGLLFAPGSPPPLPYVLLVDHTWALGARARMTESEPRRRLTSGWFARDRATMRGAVAIATFSEETRASCIADYGVSADRVHAIGAGANVLPAGEPVRADDGRTFLFIGRREFLRKGGPTLLRAFAQLREHHPDARLVMIGPSDTVPPMPGVLNLGPRPFAEVGKWLTRATVFVLPTIREPFGIAFLDAMAHGVPCIGTRVGAIPQILDGGRAGVLVEPEDADGLFAAMRRLLEDPARRAQLGQAGRSRVLEGGYTWPAVTQRLSRVLESVTPRGMAPGVRHELPLQTGA